MDRIQATDSRVLNAPPERILPVLLDVASFKLWWPASIEFIVLKEVPGGVGSEVDVRPFGGNSFCCRIERAGASEVAMTYFKGIYKGSGLWTLTPEAGGTRVAYAIDLEITSMTVRMMARMIDVKALHSKLMQDVFDGLNRRVMA